MVWLVLQPVCCYDLNENLFKIIVDKSSMICRKFVKFEKPTEWFVTLVSMPPSYTKEQRVSWLVGEAFEILKEQEQQEAAFECGVFCVKWLTRHLLPVFVGGTTIWLPQLFINTIVSLCWLRPYSGPVAMLRKRQICISPLVRAFPLTLLPWRNIHLTESCKKKNGGNHLRQLQRYHPSQTIIITSFNCMDFVV